MSCPTDITSCGLFYNFSTCQLEKPRTDISHVTSDNDDSDSGIGATTWLVVIIVIILIVFLSYVVYQNYEKVCYFLYRVNIVCTVCTPTRVFPPYQPSKSYPSSTKNCITRAYIGIVKSEFPLQPSDCYIRVVYVSSSV